MHLIELFIGYRNHYFGFQATAAKYYEQSGNNSQLFYCYTFIDDYSALEKLSQSLQENDPLLK
ncbi:unnamed protein product, partial [Rotaria sp. Silwood1]